MNLANMKRSETTEQIGLINWARANEEYVPERKPVSVLGKQLLLFNGSSKDDGRRRRESILGILGEDRDHLA